MGQINLYKIDEKKKKDFLTKLSEKFECLGQREYSYENDEKNNV